MLSWMDSSMFSVFFSATDTRESSSMPSTEPAFLISLSSISNIHIASPAHHSVKKDTGHYRLVKQPQYLAADIKRPKLPQVEELILCLPVHSEGHFITSYTGDKFLNMILKEP